MYQNQESLADGGFNLGRSSEILRDELKIFQVCWEIEKEIFKRCLMICFALNLILKNIVTPEDWESMGEHIQYDFLYDNQFAELKESELLNERLGTLATIEPYIGKYFSNHYVRTKVLRQTDQEIEELDEQIEQEIKDGTIPDPNAIDPITGQPLEGGGDLGAVPTEPDLEADGMKTDAQFQKDVKSAEI